MWVELSLTTCDSGAGDFWLSLCHRQRSNWLDARDKTDQHAGKRCSSQTSASLLVRTELSFSFRLVRSPVDRSSQHFSFRLYRAMWTERFLSTVSARWAVRVGANTICLHLSPRHSVHSDSASGPVRNRRGITTCPFLHIRFSRHLQHDENGDRDRRGRSHSGSRSSCPRRTLDPDSFNSTTSFCASPPLRCCVSCWT